MNTRARLAFTTAAALLLLALITPAHAQDGKKKKNKEAPKPAAETTAVYDTVPYKQIGDDTTLNLWVFKPEGWKADDQRPAIVFFFGGGWKSGTPKQFVPHCQHLAGRGMVAITAEYRIRNTHGTTPRDATLDARSAIRYVRAHAAGLGIDPHRLAAGGGSAGGHLAAATASITDLNEAGEDPALSAEPDALVLFNPAVNLQIPKIKDSFGDETYEIMKPLSPYQRITKDLPPTIIFHGTADEAVPYETVEAFTNKARALGRDITLKPYENRPHGFFNFGRGNGQDYLTTVQEMDDFFVKLGWLKAKDS